MHYLKTAFLFLATIPFFMACSHNNFVEVKRGRFSVNDQPYYYIGTNYWYGGLLGNSAAGKKRLQAELDFLSSKGVSNLRVMTAAEGTGLINGVQRVQPALQPTQGMFNEDILTGLDFLLAEMGKRNMKAVLFLSNNWEWSGGFLQYLNWNNLLPDTVMQRKLNWDENRDYVSKFYSCKSCTDAYEAQLRFIVGRTNKITGKKYADDTAIMAWELANEPRPMRAAAISDYTKWISQTAALIKSIDKNHLVTTGAEGDMGTENMATYTNTHSDKNIDYLTIHIWPKNWSWFKGDSVQHYFDAILANTKTYIDKHAAVARQLNKPLVIEEFGLPRDEHAFDPSSATSWRNKYYEAIFSTWQRSKQEAAVISGCNFWAFGGNARPITGQVFWKQGDEYLGDPPMEEQGLNSVFDSDETTWQLITSFSQQKN